MINKLSEEDMIFIDGSVLRFYENEALIMKKQNYKGAYKYLCKKIDEFKNSAKRNTIKVSIICNFNNTTKNLIKAIESVINQTYSNLELILVHDFSNEDMNVIKNCISADKRIKLLQNKYKEYFSWLKMGIENAAGDYIAFLNSNCIFLPEKIEKQISFMVSKDSMISLTKYGISSAKEDINVFNVDKKDIIFPNILNYCFIELSSIMINKKLLNTYSFYFDKEYLFKNDLLFLIMLSKISSINIFDAVLTNKDKQCYLQQNINNIAIIEKLSSIFALLSAEENINYYPKQLQGFLKNIDLLLLNHIDSINNKTLNKKKFNELKKIFDIKIFAVYKNHQFIIFTFLFFIKLSIKINSLALCIPIRKWRDNFINILKN